jgi:hypothetical protein
MVFVVCKETYRFRSHHFRLPSSLEQMRVFSIDRLWMPAYNLMVIALALNVLVFVVARPPEILQL